MKKISETDIFYKWLWDHYSPYYELHLASKDMEKAWQAAIRSAKRRKK